MPLALATAEWLTGTFAAELLRDHAEAEATPRLITSLRKTLSDEQAAAIVEQVELRRRATAKFRAAERMFFTRKGLEQATDEWVARYKAGRFMVVKTPCPTPCPTPSLLGGREFPHVLDVCTGVGGDLLGLVQAGHDVAGIDRDAVLAHFAQHNATPATVHSATADEETIEQCNAWHADPDRRAGGRRSTQPDQHDPSLAQLAAWRVRTPAAAIKLAPAARLPDSWQAECELEWISRSGECRQLVAWCGPLAKQSGKRRATRVFENQSPATVCGIAESLVPHSDSIRRYVYEPDPAVIAARLVGAQAEQHGVTSFAPVAYLTGDQSISDPLLAAFEVEEVLPLDRKRLTAYLAHRNVGQLEIKCRGVRIDPAKLRKELRPQGNNAATLLLAPLHNKPTVIIAQRLA